MKINEMFLLKPHEGNLWNRLDLTVGSVRWKIDTVTPPVMVQGLDRKELEQHVAKELVARATAAFATTLVQEIEGHKNATKH